MNLENCRPLLRIRGNSLDEKSLKLAPTRPPILPIQPGIRKEFAMSKTAVTSPDLTPPVGPFSQAIEVGGFIFFSGQVGQDPGTGRLGAGGGAARARRHF